MVHSVSLHDLYILLQHTPDLAAASLEQYSLYVRLAVRLKREILHDQEATWDEKCVPNRLPPRIVDFLSDAMQWKPLDVLMVWKALGRTIWEMQLSHGDQPSVDELDIWKRHGHSRHLTYHNLYPSYIRCENESCKRQGETLLRRKDGPRKKALYTLHGSWIAYDVHLVCHACSRNYEHNYSVSDGYRTYYPGVPTFLQVGEHQFISRDVLSLVIGMMLIAWTSATNAARIYNECLSTRTMDEPTDDDSVFEVLDSAPPPALRTEHIWDGIVLLALLEDHESRSRILVVPHTGAQSKRFNDAMAERNGFIEDQGQPESSHYCDKCCRVWPNDPNNQDEEPKKLRVVVTDGITIGHPCCSIAHCPEPLISNQHRFCKTHMTENQVCAVQKCRNGVDEGWLTCQIQAHRAMELDRRAANKGFFQLRDRMARQKVAHPNDAFAAQATDDVEIAEATLKPGEDPICEEKDQNTGTSKLRARFGRRRSHNEQILVRPCGIIVARATFFGSETTPQTVDFLERTFKAPGSMPEIVIYDLGCQLFRHLKSEKNRLYEKVGFPVDVFHWKTKHKKNTDECAFDCNPVLFPELIGEDGVSWFFNSSIAEQTNVWLGGYHAMLREMSQVKYNFFLDEMILRKNRLIKKSIEGRGWNPGYVPGL